MERESRQGNLESLVGMYAVSKAGHDKADLYIIIEESQTHVQLADGRLKTLKKPKKKNKKHIQPIKSGINPELRRRLSEEPESVTDEIIKKAIKQYQKAK